MKTKLLLAYGYVLPILSSVAISSLPMFFRFDYAEIAVFYSTNQELLIGFFIGIAAIAFPFQNSIINDDNPHVLEVLKQTKVREVFVFASMFQAILIVGLLFLILILSAIKNQTYLVGYFQMLSSSLIAFEIMVLISNGHAYSEIREKIITEVNKAERQKH